MNKRMGLVIILAVAFTAPVATMIMAQQAGVGRNGASSRPEGPCDIYAAGNTPCVAAHSTTRALFAAYNGPLYQVLRQSDGKTLDIGVVQPSAGDAGGYADAAAQDGFCANTYCWISVIYDQSGHKNNMTQAPRGGTGSPTAMGGFNSIPIADMAPITIMGHKAYGIFIEAGMGMRNDNPHGTAVDDQAEGQYWVVNGHHYNGGCCFDYGNAEIDSHDDGAGTMETTYFGSATAWYKGPPPGPWIMTDQENNLVGCVTDDGTKNCALPIIKWRFVTGTADGEPHHWRSMGGDAQGGEMQIMFDGKRVDNQYDPMRKQGAILMGNGGDNSNSSAGTIYEAAMTAGGTFPSQETNQKLQANIVAAKYDVQRLSVTPASATDAPPGLQTFAPRSSQETTVTFTNTTGAPVTNLELSINVPQQWTSVVSGSAATSKKFTDAIAPGASVSATFKITTGPAAFSGDIDGKASWSAAGRTQSEMMAEKVRNVSPIKINEFAVSSTTPANPTNSFIELYNAAAGEVDISNWTLTEHASQQAIFSSIKIPAGTKIASKGFYVLGLSNSGLAVPAKKGDTVIHVRSVTGMNVGDTIEIDTGSGIETRKIASLGTAAGNNTTLWQPLPEGPVITIPAGSTSVPVTSVSAGGGRGGRGGAPAAPVTPFFSVGEKVALGYGATYPVVAKDLERYEVVTVTAVGNPGTQTVLGAAAKAGDTSFKVRNAANIAVGDKITLDIDSKDHGVDVVTVKSVSTPPPPPADAVAPPAAAAPPAGAPAAGAAPGGRAGRGGGRGGGGLTTVELTAPLKFNHASNLPFNDRGTGISFQPATAFAHSTNEPVLPLGTGITLDKPLSNDHEINAVVRDAAVTTEGYQGTAKPNQWFGGPALTNSGNIVLRDALGHVADSLNFGGHVDPWAGEGYQAKAAGSGCSVAAPGGGRGGGGRGRGAPAADAAPAPNRSAGRTSDGVDTDSNCTDFQGQSPTPGAPNQTAVAAPRRGAAQ